LSNFKDLPDAEIVEICTKSMQAITDAYAPYSQYKVGAAVLLDSGMIISGSNQENAVYPLGLCAERVALFSASSQYPDESIKAIAVATTKPLREGDLAPFPCGSCRQVLIEIELRQKSSIVIYVVGSDYSVCVVQSVLDILPFAFDSDSL